MKTTMKTTMVLVALFAGVHSQAFPDVTSVLDNCSGDSDVFSCLKFRAVRLLDNALATDSLSISDFVTVVKDPKRAEEDDHKEEYRESFPRDLQQNDTALDKMLMDRVQKYFETRTIQLKVPDEIFEGRRRKGGYGGGGMKKGGGLMMMMFAGLGTVLLQLALAAIAAVSGKALLVSKIALLLASFFGLKSLMNHQPYSPPAQVVYAEPDIHHGGWGRSSYSPEVAQDLAYGAHKGQKSS